MHVQKLLFILLCCIATLTAKSQFGHSYTELIAQGNQLYFSKDYDSAAKIYLQAFSLKPAEVPAEDHYNLACIWTQARNIDAAFKQLNLLATTYKFLEYNQLIVDSDLAALRNDRRWDTVCLQIKKNKVQAEKDLNKRLVAQLDTILDNDQKYRSILDSIEKKYGYASKESQLLWTQINKADSINMILVSRILHKYGWPGPKEIGKRGNTICLVIQHSNLKNQEKYAPIMKKAVLEHKIDPGWYAILVDRMYLREGKKQIYGSQLHGNPNGEPWVSPMIDPDHVDKRRASVGLEPMSQYVQQWNVKWDVEKYKKELPQIEEWEKAPK